MISRHVYSAFLIGTPDVALSVRRAGSRIILDDASAPHVTGTIELAVPTMSTLVALDPRAGRRIRVRVVYTSGNLSVTREFNLAITDRTLRLREGIVVVDLASDESLASDFAPFTKDTTPYQHQGSVVSLVNYVLGRAITGTALQTGQPNPAIRALIASTNLVRNPRAARDLLDWAGVGGTVGRLATGGPSVAPTTGYLQANGSSIGIMRYLADGVAVRAGETYRLGVFVNVGSGNTVAVDALVLDNNGNLILDVPQTFVASVAGGQWLYTTFTAPANATKAELRVFTGSALAANAYMTVTGWRLSPVTDDPTDTGYFDAETLDTSEYAYDPTGVLHASPTTRTPLINRAPDLLTWMPGTSAYDFLNPILQALGLRLVCDEARRWTLRDEGYVASGALSIRHAVNLIDGSDRLSRTGGWRDAQITRYRWRDQTGAQREEIDAFALVTPYKRCVTLDIEAPYPGPGRSAYGVRRAQGLGRELTLEAVADWTARAEQRITAVISGAPIQTGRTARVEFDLATDRMRIVTRTADTASNAIDLLAGTINGLTGTINNL